MDKPCFFNTGDDLYPEPCIGDDPQYPCECSYSPWITCDWGKLNSSHKDFQLSRLARARKIMDEIHGYLESSLKKNKSMYGTQYSVGQLTRIIKRHL